MRDARKRQRERDDALTELRSALGPTPLRVGLRRRASPDPLTFASSRSVGSKARYLEVLKQNVKRARISRQLEHDLSWLDDPGLNDEALGAVPLPLGDGVT